MQLFLICIFTLGAYLVGRYSAKVECEEKLLKLRIDHNILKKAFNKLIQDEEKKEEPSYGTKQGYWEAEDDFHINQ